MTRNVLSLLAACLFIGLVAGPGCQPNGVGDPCTPDEEYASNFAGFNVGEVNVESKSFQCRTRLCLGNHFQGRVSCPYGQDENGNAPPGLKATDPNGGSASMNAGCVVPGTNIPIDPTCGQSQTTSTPCPSSELLNPAPKSGKTVLAQCVDRTTAQAVYCSCRCANVNGETGDGSVYCNCPDGYTCKPPNGAPLVSSIGTGDTGLTGYYCYKTGTDYDPTSACAETCDPIANPCP
jgi:hypothetical protein